MPMSASQAHVIERLVDTARYPVSDPTSGGWHEVVSRVRQEMHTVGCSVLPDFVSADRQAELQRECADLTDRAYYDVETVNVYNTAPDPSLPEDHPAHATVERGNAFVARDALPDACIINRLYTNPLFQQFIASCFGLPRLHELADPLSGLCLNVVTPGHSHPWHFDTNEFTVSMLTQASQSGGVFEYCSTGAVRTWSNDSLCTRATCSCSRAVTPCTGWAPCRVRPRGTRRSLPTASVPG